MKKAFWIMLAVILLFCSACTGNPDTSQSSPIEPPAPPETNESSTPSNDISTLREEYFEFAIENRLDYIPLFDEGKAPSSSAEYLFYAFAINLDNWGDDKGTMSRDYVEQVIHTHFDVDKITHSSLRKGWDYDGEKYTAIPQGIKDKPIYVLQDYKTRRQNGRTIYEITMDDCSSNDGLPTEEEIRADIVAGDLSALTVQQTEYFQYYLDETTGEVVFLSHTLAQEQLQAIE